MSSVKVILDRWPSALGLAAAIAVLASAAERETVAISLGVATLCYLGAAALDRRWVGWAGVLGGSLIVVLSEVAGLAWWAGIGIMALVLIVIGVLMRVPRIPLTAQTLAMLGYGGVAVAALLLAPQAGLVLAGLALAAHGIWDLIHYRRDQVVNRSLAEACMLLDIPLGIGVVVLAFVNN